MTTHSRSVGPTAPGTPGAGSVEGRGRTRPVSRSVPADGGGRTVVGGETGVGVIWGLLPPAPDPGWSGVLYPS
ncbi:hypothetical protein GCM10009832_19990 [Dietzia kunjamensis subsp. schimae]